jgi:hypothetical protein
MEHMRLLLGSEAADFITQALQTVGHQSPIA